MISLPKVSNKEVYESWRSFFGLTLKDDLCNLLLGQLKYFKETAIKHDLISEDNKFENFGNDLGRICEALSEDMSTLGNLLHNNSRYRYKDLRGKSNFRQIGNYLLMNRNVREALYKNLENEKKSSNFERG